MSICRGRFDLIVLYYKNRLLLYHLLLISLLEFVILGKRWACESIKFFAWKHCKVLSAIIYFLSCCILVAILSWRSSWFLILLSWLHFVLDYIKLSLLWLVSIANQTCILKFWFTHYNIIIFLRRLYAYHGYLGILFRLSSSLVFIVSFLNFIAFERVSILFQLSLCYYIFLDFIVVLKILLLL